MDDNDVIDERGRRVDSAVAQYLESLERGSPLEQTAFLQQHAEIADELREFLGDYEALKRAAGQARGAVNGFGSWAGLSARHAVHPCEPLVVEGRFADYELIEEIARGGMGVVYKARQVSLNRIVALKMILAGQFASQAEVDRFYAEAALAATLDHPQIVPIFEVGQHGGQHYFSMGYVAGESLAERLLKGPMPAREAATVIRDVARAVHYAHQRGIIHRDLKPANILFDSDGRVRVTDFGLAKRQTDVSCLTVTGQLLGTPSYMSPEQVTGRNAEIGPASDVFSLGSTLYALITGRPPFHAASTVDTLKQVAEQDPVHPQEFDSAVPRDVETIALKSLEKLPARRYATAQELAEDLERFLGDRPILARRSTRPERFVRWYKRNRVVAALSGLVLLVLVGGATVSTLLAIQANNTAARLRAERDRAELLENKKTRADQRGAELEGQLATNLFKRASAEYQSGSAARAIALLEGAYEAAVSEPLLCAWYRNLMSGWSGEVGKLLLHDGQVWKVAFSPNGRMIATGSSSGAVQFWDAHSGRPLADALEHDDCVPNLAFSPDGRTLVTACLDGYVRLWDVRSRKQVREPLKHEYRICTVAFSPDGRLMSTTDTVAARLWDVASGELLLDSITHDGASRSTAFSPDGRRFVVGGHAARMWNTQTAEKIGQPLQMPGLIQGISFSPDGRFILTGCSNGTAQLWDAASGKPVSDAVKHEEPVAIVAFSANDRLFLTAGGNTVRLWDTQTRAPVGDPLRHGGPLPVSSLNVALSPVAFSPDSRAVLTGSDDATARVWDAQTGKPLRPALRHGGRVCSVAYSPDGQTIATASFDRTARLWSSDSGERIGDPIRVGAAVLDVSVSKDGRLILTASADGTAQLWNAETNRASGRPMRHKGAVSTAIFDPAYARVLTTGEEGTVRQWDVKTGDPTGSRIACQRSPSTAAYSPDGRFVLTASDDKSASLWDARTGERVGPPLPAMDTVYCVAFSPNGRTVALGTSNWLVQLYDLETGDLQRTIRHHEAWINCLAFSPDGETLATGSADGTARLCDVHTGETVGEPMRHRSDVLDLAFSPDGRAIITGSSDGTAQLWDAMTGTPLAQPVQYSGAVTAVAFSPDGQSVLTGCGDGTVQRWKAPPPALPDDLELIRAWVRARTGLQVDSQGSLRYLRQDDWLAAEKELEKLRANKLPH